jgi:hypothetical protein
MEGLDGDVDGEHVGWLPFVVKLGTTWRLASRLGW